MLHQTAGNISKLPANLGAFSGGQRFKFFRADQPGTRRCSFDSLLPERIVNEPALFEESHRWPWCGEKLPAEKATVAFYHVAG